VYVCFIFVYIREREREREREGFLLLIIYLVNNSLPYKWIKPETP